MARFAPAVFVCSWLAAPALAQVPAAFPHIDVQFLGDPAPGYIFLSNFILDPQVDNTPYLMVLDNSGWPVKCKQLTTPLNLDFKQQPDGSLTYCDGLSWWVLDQDLDPVAGLQAGDGWTTDAHELRFLPDGTALLLAWRPRTADMTAYGGRRNAILQDYAIQQIDRADGRVVWQWDTASHFEVDDATGDVDLTGAFIDWVHCNAIDVDTDGNLLLSSRHLDQITKIDRATGAVLWRLGGSACENNDFRFEDDDQPQADGSSFFGFSHQHGVRRLASGHILLFDNGNLKNPHASRAVEYALDEAGRVARKVWEYRNAPEVESDEMGFAQRLENGNTLVAWGGSPQSVAVTEVTPGCAKLVEMTLPAEVYSYRGFRLVWGMAAVTRTVPGPGSYDFDAAGNVTGVRLDVNQVSGSGSLTVQRHEYAAHAQSFSGSVPEVVEPYRWVITQDALGSWSAGVALDLSTLPAVVNPSWTMVYWRGREGAGDFAPCATTYDRDAGELRASLGAPGEILLGQRSISGSGVPQNPAAMRLWQAGPSPDAGRCVLQFQLPHAGRVRLDLFDARGREVLAIVDADYPAGAHAVGFDASGLGSGTYFCRMQSGGRHARTKVTLLP